MAKMPIYPVYVPSKGRADNCQTAKFLEKDEVPHFIVIEEQEYDLYAAKHPEKNLLVLPFSNRGSVIPARNWIKGHATEAGHKRHWQLDDNIARTRRWYKGKRIPCKSGLALRICEDFTERYTNIAISGLQYTMFCVPSKDGLPPFYLNSKVYSCSLVLNSLPYEWRGRYNEDTDICLQALADGWCTVVLNAFMVDKMGTMQAKGGNTDELYVKKDGRLNMAKSLERVWPYVVETKRRFQRPQHVVRDAWRKFDTPLIRRDDIDWDALKGKTDNYGMKLKATRKEIKSKAIQKLLDEANNEE